MSYTYTTYSAALATMMSTDPTQADFIAIRPSIIDYAEQRIYRELDLFATNVTDTSATLSANTRSLTMPTSIGTFIVIGNINVLTPVGSSPATGTRNPVQSTSRDVIDLLYPSGSTANGVPQYFAMIDPGTAMFGPAPDANYPVEIVGTQRPNPLTASNTTTILTTYLPDLFMAASMVFASGFMRNFGSQADDPKMATSWEGQYQLLKASAQTEQQRQNFASWGWTSETPSPVANAPR
jgi:hypothetical protein